MHRLASGFDAVVAVLQSMMEAASTLRSASDRSSLSEQTNCCAHVLRKQRTRCDALPSTLDQQTFGCTGVPPGTFVCPALVEHDVAMSVRAWGEGCSLAVIPSAGSQEAMQVLDFQRLLGAERTLDTNSRPVMPLNGRRFDYENVGDVSAKAMSSSKSAGSFRAADGSKADAKAVSDDSPPLYDITNLDVLTGRSWGHAR